MIDLFTGSWRCFAKIYILIEIVRCDLSFAKRFNHFVYDIDHIVEEDIFIVNDSVNCLYESWQVDEMFYKVKRLIDVVCVVYKVKKLFEMFVKIYSY